MSFFVYLVLKSSRRIEHFLGRNGLSVIRKVFGVILLAIAVKTFCYQRQSVVLNCLRLNLLANE